MQTLMLTAESLASHPVVLPGEKAITYRREGTRNQYVTFSSTMISFSISKTFKRQRFKEVIGHWPEMSISMFDKLARQRLSDIEMGQWTKAGKVRLGDFFIDYVFPQMQSHNRDIKSVKTRWRRIMPSFAHRPLCDVTRMEIESFLVKLSESVTGATVNRHLSLLSRIFSAAVSLDMLAKNPCRGIKKWAENNIRHRVLNQSEMDLYVLEASKIDTPQSRALLLSLFLGLRIGNVISITKSMVDLPSAKLYLPLTKSGKAHTVSLNDAALLILRRSLATSTNNWVFPSYINDGEHIAYPRSCHEKLKAKVLQKFPSASSFNIHDLRRTYASRLLTQTGDARLVQMSLFHQSMATTERYAFHQSSTLLQASQATASSMLSPEAFALLEGDV